MSSRKRRLNRRKRGPELDPKVVKALGKDGMREVDRLRKVIQVNDIKSERTQSYVNKTKKAAVALSGLNEDVLASFDKNDLNFVLRERLGDQYGKRQDVHDLAVPGVEYIKSDRQYQKDQQEKFEKQQEESKGWVDHTLDFGKDAAGKGLDVFKNTTVVGKSADLIWNKALDQNDRDSIKENAGEGLSWTLDKISRPSYAVNEGHQQFSAADDDSAGWSPSGIWDAVAKWNPSSAILTALTGSSPLESWDDIIKDPSKLGDIFSGIKDGFTGKEKTTWSDNIEANANREGGSSDWQKAYLENDWYKGITGFGLDVAADPLNFVGVGLVKKPVDLARKVTTSGSAPTEEAAEFAYESALESMANSRIDRSEFVNQGLLEAADRPFLSRSDLYKITKDLEPSKLVEAQKLIAAGVDEAEASDLLKIEGVGTHPLAQALRGRASAKQDEIRRIANEAGLSTLADDVLKKYDPSEASKAQEEFTRQYGSGSFLSAIRSHNDYLRNTSPIAATDEGGKALKTRSVNQTEYNRYKAKEVEAGRTPMSSKKWSEQFKPFQQALGDEWDSLKGSLKPAQKAQLDNVMDDTRAALMAGTGHRAERFIQIDKRIREYTDVIKKKKIDILKITDDKAKKVAQRNLDKVIRARSELYDSQDHILSQNIASRTSELVSRFGGIEAQYTDAPRAEALEQLAKTLDKQLSGEGAGGAPRRGPRMPPPFDTPKVEDPPWDYPKGIDNSGKAKSSVESINDSIATMRTELKKAEDALGTIEKPKPMTDVQRMLAKAKVDDLRTKLDDAVRERDELLDQSPAQKQKTSDAKTKVARESADQFDDAAESAIRQESDDLASDSSIKGPVEADTYIDDILDGDVSELNRALTSPDGTYDDTVFLERVQERIKAKLDNLLTPVGTLNKTPYPMYLMDDTGQLSHQRLAASISFKSDKSRFVINTNKLNDIMGRALTDEEELFLKKATTEMNAQLKTRLKTTVATQAPKEVKPLVDDALRDSGLRGAEGLALPEGRAAKKPTSNRKKKPISQGDEAIANLEEIESLKNPSRYGASKNPASREDVAKMEAVDPKNRRLKDFGPVAVTKSEEARRQAAFRKDQRAIGPKAFAAAESKAADETIDAIANVTGAGELHGAELATSVFDDVFSAIKEGALTKDAFTRVNTKTQIEDAARAAVKTEREAIRDAARVAREAMTDARRLKNVDEVERLALEIKDLKDQYNKVTTGIKISVARAMDARRAHQKYLLQDMTLNKIQNSVDPLRTYQVGIGLRLGTSNVLVSYKAGELARKFMDSNTFLREVNKAYKATFAPPMSTLPLELQKHRHRITANLPNIIDTNLRNLYDDLGGVKLKDRKKAYIQAFRSAEKNKRPTDELAGKVYDRLEQLLPYFQGKYKFANGNELKWHDITAYMPEEFMNIGDLKAANFKDMASFVKAINPGPRGTARMDIQGRIIPDVDPMDILWHLHIATDQAFAMRGIAENAADSLGFRMSIKTDGKGLNAQESKASQKVNAEINKLRNQGWRPVEKVGSSTLFPPEYADKLDQLFKQLEPRNVKQMGRTMDSALGYWKGMVTVLNPGYYTRNFVGEVLTGMLGGVYNPKYYKDAAKVMRLADGEREAVEKAFKSHTPYETYKGDLPTGGTTVVTLPNGHKVSYTEAKVMFRDGGNESAFINEEYTNRVVDSNPWKSNAVATAGRNSWTKLRTMGETAENFPRMAHFLHALEHAPKHLKTTEDIIEYASGEVRKYHFDYTNVTNFEKSTMMRVFPFYKWTRMAVPLMLQSLVLQPQKINAVPKAMTAISTGSGNGDDTEGYEMIYSDLVPEYIRDMYGYRIKDKDGSEGEDDTYLSIATPQIDALKSVFDPGGSATAMANPYVMNALNITNSLTGGDKVGNPYPNREPASTRDIISDVLSYTPITRAADRATTGDMDTERLISFLTGAGVYEDKNTGFQERYSR